MSCTHDYIEGTHITELSDLELNLSAIKSRIVNELELPCHWGSVEILTANLL